MTRPPDHEHRGVPCSIDHPAYHTVDYSETPDEEFLTTWCDAIAGVAGENELTRRIRSMLTKLAVTEEQVDAAQDAFHEFVFGLDAPRLTHREKGITRQAWRVALQAARDA